MSKVDLSKLKIVPIDDVRPNPWNPKRENHLKYLDVRKSIEKHGFKAPIQVRQNDGLEIIDGEQRWRAAKELGYTEVIVYDNGRVSDEDAKNETLWWQVQVPFEETPLADLVVELHKLDAELPFTSAEIANFEKIVQANNEPEPEEDEPDIRTLSIKLTKAQFDVVMQAIEAVKEEEDCSESRAIELICADYLAK